MPVNCNHIQKSYNICCLQVASVVFNSDKCQTTVGSLGCVCIWNVSNQSNLNETFNQNVPKSISCSDCVCNVNIITFLHLVHRIFTWENKIKQDLKKNNNKNTVVQTPQVKCIYKAMLTSTLIIGA